MKGFDTGKAAKPPVNKGAFVVYLFLRAGEENDFFFP